LDVGHALFGYENMAESVALMARFGDRLMHLHLNDNYRYWDQDMIPCSVHTLEWIELFHWLDRMGYQGWFSLDIFAYREKEKVAVATESLAWLDAISAAAERLDSSEVDEIWKTQDAMRAQAALREALLGK
jgi:sugar phosphate isomerase/epimerase